MRTIALSWSLFKNLARDFSFSFWSVLTPILLFGVMHLLKVNKIIGTDYSLLPVILVYTSMTVGLINLPLIAGMFGEQGIVKRLLLTPVKPLAFFLSLGISRLLEMLIISRLLEMLIISVLLLLANALAGYAFPGSPVLLTGITLYYTLISLAWGFAVMIISSDFLKIKTISNLIFLVLILAGNVFFHLPDNRFTRLILAINPAYAVHQGITAAFAGNSITIYSVLYPAVTGIVCLVLFAFAVRRIPGYAE